MPTLPDKKEVIDRLKKAAKQGRYCLPVSRPRPRRGSDRLAHRRYFPKGQNQTSYIQRNHQRRRLRSAQTPSSIDQALVDAQQARRLLDRIVGYKISPILTRRVQGARDGGLSAGRVQSVALKLVVDREKEIEAFIPVEYWNIARTSTNKKNKKIHFHAGSLLCRRQTSGKRRCPVKNISLIPNAEAAQEIVS